MDKRKLRKVKRKIKEKKNKLSNLVGKEGAEKVVKAELGK